MERINKISCKSSVLERLVESSKHHRSKQAVGGVTRASKKLVESGLIEGWRSELMKEFKEIKEKKNKVNPLAL